MVFRATETPDDGPGPGEDPEPVPPGVCEIWPIDAEVFFAGMTVSDPQGIATIELDDEHVLTSAQSIKITLSDVPSSFPYQVRLTLPSPGFEPNTLYLTPQSVYPQAGTNWGFSGSPIPDEQWSEFGADDEVSDANGVVEFSVAFTVTEPYTPGGRVIWVDRLRIATIECLGEGNTTPDTPPPTPSGLLFQTSWEDGE